MKLNNEFHSQIKLTRMAKIFTPTYATLSMEYFENKIHSACSLKYEKLLAA